MEVELRDTGAWKGVPQMCLIVEKNLMVPMRDGVKLATDVYRPDVSEAVPTLVQRVPYNKERTLVQNYIVDLLRAAQAGYAVGVQDCRGTSAVRRGIQPAFSRRADMPSAQILSPLIIAMVWK
jgi:hypothetical protein